jgi:hypothetical protein
VKFKSSAAMILPTVLLAACVNAPIKAYDGPTLEDAETALIRVQPRSSDRIEAIVRILSFDSARGEVVPIETTSLRVQPRGVCVEASATTSSMDQFVANLCFESKAGRHYEVRALTRGSPRPPQLGASGSQIQIPVDPESV